MPSRHRVQLHQKAPANPPQAVKRAPGAPMLPATLAAAIGVVRHDRQLAAVRLGASRRLGSHLRAVQPQKAATAKQPSPVPPQLSQHHLEEAAYYRYLQRAGASGSPEGDWYAAEQDMKNPPGRS